MPKHPGPMPTTRIIAPSTTLDGVIRLTLTIRRCPNPACSGFLRPYRPEAEPHFALPYHEFGLDVIALVGRLRYAEHRSIPEIHREVDPPRDRRRRAAPSPTSWVATMSCRALATADPGRLGPLLPQARRAASSWPIDGLQPDVGHEVTSGSCATASRARSSWPRASCRPPPRTWPA